MTEIVEIAAAATHDLRKRVLRDGTPTDVLVWEGDDEPTTFHLGACADGGLIAISTWLHRRYPDRPGEQAVQLRGMAVDPSKRGTGVGGQLLHAGIARCVDEDATLLWARSRVEALSFYLRHGFEAVGPEYTDLTTGLRHRDILRKI